MREPLRLWRAVARGVVMASFLTACAAQGQEVASADVVAVSDGDTVHLMLNGRRTRVRLAQVDAPEHGQPFGRRSEQSLRDLVWKKTVVLRWSEIDRHGRPIVTITTVAGLDVGEEQVRRGMAWVYRRYSRDATLLRLESEARDERRGLWADPHAVPPWEWRRSKSVHRDGPRPDGAGTSPVP
jgi:micrococcal nuclease